MKLNITIIRQRRNGKTRRVFLDELDPSAGNYNIEKDISCGILCGD